MEVMDKNMNSFDKLMFLNKELFKMVENSISLDLLARLYSSQLVTRGDRHLLDHNRTYFKVLRQIVVEGQSRGQITEKASVNEIVNVYAMCERAFLYDCVKKSTVDFIVKIGITIYLDKNSIE